nr:hypothetical protein [Tanacetum cinerariifolium]
MKALQKTVDGHHRATNRRSRIGLWYPCRLYVSGHVDIFDMVDIDLFTAIALNMMFVKLGYTGEFEPMFYNYLRALTSLDEGLYALACKKDIRCLATLVRCFKLVEVYIEHDVTALDSYIRPPWFRVTIEDITDEPSSIATNRIGKILLLTWHEFSEPTKEPICDSVTPRSLPQHDSKLDGEAGFADVVRSGVESFGLSHDESFGVDNLDLNLNEPEDESAHSNGQFFYDDEGIDTAYETEYDVQSSEDACTDDEDEDFYVDEENEIVELDVDAYLFGISMYVPFDNICVTNLVSCNVLEGDDVDVINTDGFDSKPGKDDEISNYRRRRRNLKLYKNDSVKIRARCNGKVPVFIMSQGFNGKTVGGRDKPVITLLEYIREYCMEKIANVQSVIDKCTSPLSPTAARIMESIKKEAHFIKVQWNGANKYQLSACWNMALNDRAKPPLEAWVNPCYWLTTWKETYCHKIQPINETNYWKSPHVQQHFCHPSIMSRHNKAKCKGQLRKETTGDNNAESSGSTSRQAQQTDPVVGQYSLGGTSVGAIIGLSAADGQCGADGTGGAGVGVGSQGLGMEGGRPAPNPSHCHSYLENDQYAISGDVGYENSLGYGLLSLNSLWFLVKCRHKYAVSSLMDMAYWLLER